MQRTIFTLILAAAGCGGTFDPDLSGTGTEGTSTSSTSTETDTSDGQTTSTDNTGTTNGSETSSESTTDGTGGSFCGDGVVEGDEECDGEALDENSCFNLGMAFTGGVLLCGEDCTLDPSHCYGPSCGSSEGGLHQYCAAVGQNAECAADVSNDSICYSTWGPTCPLCTRPCEDDSDCASPNTEGCGSPSYCDSIKGVCLLDCSLSKHCPEGMYCGAGESDTGEFCRHC